jgi:hypothetical protein
MIFAIYAISAVASVRRKQNPVTAVSGFRGPADCAVSPINWTKGTDPGRSRSWPWVSIPNAFGWFAIA